MAHDVILGAIKRHLDDLKLRNPRLYAAEERDLMKQEHRLDYEVGQSPIAIPADRRYELHIKRAERNQYR